MSIELKQAAQQVLDLSTPTLREMVTRHAAVIDSRATLEDMPEALAFQIDMARALLREFTAIQQAEAQQPVTGEPVMDVRCEGCGYMTHHREHMGCVRSAKQHTHPAPSVPSDVVRDAERYRWLADCNNYEAGLALIIDPKLTAHTLGEKIDAAMLAAK